MSSTNHYKEQLIELEKELAFQNKECWHKSRGIYQDLYAKELKYLIDKIKCKFA